MRLPAALALALACAAPARAGYDDLGLAAAGASVSTGAAPAEGAGAAADGETADGYGTEAVQLYARESAEEQAALVLDYIRRDVALKGAFLLEDPAAKKVLRLTLVSADPASRDAGGGARTVTALFRDAAGRKYSVVFRLQAGPWGGLDIYRLTLSALPDGGKEKKK